MKFLVKTTILLATGLAPFYANAAATPQTQNITFSSASSRAAGAAYFMNNDPTANYLFAADIGADAKVTLRSAYYTGGRGAQGTGNNVLFSQGPVSATHQRTGNFEVVAVVNPGSNTVTVFKINPNNPSQLRMLGRPVYSGGDFPVSVAINNAGDMVCTLNSGAINGVSCFQLDSRRGLIPLPNTTRSLGLNKPPTPVNPDMTASNVIFTEDDKKLVAAAKGTLADPKNKPAFIAAWDINSDKSLSAQFTRMEGGVWLWSLTQVPGRNAFLGSDLITSTEIFNLDALAQNSSAQAGNLPIPGEVALCWSAYSKDTNNFYQIDFGLPSVDEVHVDSNLNANLVAVHPLDRFDGASDPSINHVNGKDRLYLLASNATSVEVFDIQGPGNFQRIQKLNVGALAGAAGIPFNPHAVAGMATFIL